MVVSFPGWSERALGSGTKLEAELRRFIRAAQIVQKAFTSVRRTRARAEGADGEGEGEGEKDEEAAARAEVRRLR